MPNAGTPQGNGRVSASRTQPIRTSVVGKDPRPGRGPGGSSSELVIAPRLSGRAVALSPRGVFERDRNWRPTLTISLGYRDLSPVA
jgi:hypothetical protein